MGRLEILKKLCKEKGITINKLEQELEFSHGSLGHQDDGTDIHASFAEIFRGCTE